MLADMGISSHDRRASSARGVAIQLHLAEGDWSGLVVADAPARNCKVLTLPRTRWRDVAHLEDLQRSGICLLTGPDPDLRFGLRGYVGESDSLAHRAASEAAEEGDNIAPVHLSIRTAYRMPLEVSRPCQRRQRRGHARFAQATDRLWVRWHSHTR